MSRTRVVNLAREHCDVQITRPGPFGNPHPIGGCPECQTIHDRQDAIRAYREYLVRRVQTDPEFKKLVDNLRGKVLGCWCKPQPCHGDVLVRYLAGAYEDQISPGDVSVPGST